MTTKPDDLWVSEDGVRVKAWFAMRRDIEMSKGKFGVQIGHGTDLIHMLGDENPFYAEWLAPTGGNRRKIILQASEEDIRKLTRLCVESAMIVDPIWDAGLTEFGEATQTGVVIHPHRDDNIPKVLRRARAWQKET